MWKKQNKELLAKNVHLHARSGNIWTHEPVHSKMACTNSRWCYVQRGGSWKNENFHLVGGTRHMLGLAW